MPLINHSLDNIISGVSQQYTEARNESQVEELLNCIPSVSRGVLRRNPIAVSSRLHDIIGTIPTDLKDAFTYTYDRGTGDEQYMFIIPTDDNGNWYVFKLKDPTEHWTGQNDYFITPTNFKAKDIFKALTIGDHTFISNSTLTVKASTTNNSESEDAYNKWAFYWIKLTTQVVTDQKSTSSGETTDSGSRLEGYTYVLNTEKVTAVKDTRPGASDPDLASAYRIADAMAANNGSWSNQSNSAFVYSKTETSSWDWEDSNGNLASLGVWHHINYDNELPAGLPATLDGFITKVTGGSSSEKDDYYLKYDNTIKTWDEVAKPGISKGLDASTMPHVLYALGTPTNRTFIIDEYKKVNEAGDGLEAESEWKDRESGDLETNKDPSFVGNTINSLFFYFNRLGLLSDNTLVMSSVGEYGDFYFESIQKTQDDGHIDIKVATSDVVQLRRAIPTDASVIIFADKAQFLLSSGDEAFTSETAELSVLSNYDYHYLMDAQAVGSSIYFGSVSGGYSRIFKMKMNNYELTRGVEAENISVHLPTYIDKGIYQLIGHDTLGLIFIHSEEVPNTITVLNSVTYQEELIQQAFHTWEFQENIASIHIEANCLFILIFNSDLATINLEIPGDIKDVDYRDITPSGAKETYLSGIYFSKFHVRDERKLGTSRGRFQLRTMKYGIVPYSEYRTTIRNLEHGTVEYVNCFQYDWHDDLTWIDTDIWIDVAPSYDRIYTNDSKITVMSSSSNVKIVLTNNPDVPEKGFELSTVNIEGFYYQRSQRN